MTSREGHPPCRGKVALFESIDPIDHQEARAICLGGCPFIRECRDRLEDTKREWGYSHLFGPRGTWAGQLCAPPHPTNGERKRGKKDRVDAA